ncbi:TPA: glycosyltransferase [Streptococcus suis]
MIKVLHILNTGSFSGAENVVITMIKQLEPEVDSIYASKNGLIADVLAEEKINFYPVKQISPVTIRRIVNDIKPDIIHTHDFTAGIMAAFSFSGVPIINHLHSNPPWLKSYSLKSFIYLLSSFNYKKILTVSNSVLDDYVFGKIISKKLSVIGNPISIMQVLNKVSEGRKVEYDLAFLGRLSDEKNPLLFLDIVSTLKEQRSDIKAVMIGDGPLRNRVLEKIDNLQLNDVVTMMGFKRNPFPILRTASVLCMPSKWEGFGLAAVEALALGIPVCCSNTGGLPMIVNDTCGKICENKEEYIVEITGLLNEQDYYLTKQKGAFLRASELDNIEEYSGKMYGLYKGLKRD